MKTLDEIIKALEVCTSDRGGCGECPFNDNCKPDDKWDDALHYLKHLQEYYEMSKEHEPNDPLTWDELRQMEGKPVWIQEGDHSYWIIIKNFSETIYGYHWLNSAEGSLEKEYMGISWQAYRKELD